MLLLWAGGSGDLTSYIGGLILGVILLSFHLICPVHSRLAVFLKNIVRFPCNMHVGVQAIRQNRTFIKILHRSFLDNPTSIPGFCWDGSCIHNHTTSIFNKILSSHTLGVLSRPCFLIFCYLKLIENFPNYQVLVPFCLTVLFPVYLSPLILP